MKKRHFSALILLLAAQTAHSQITIGSGGMFISSGTTLSLDQLSLTPSSDYTLANTTLTTSATPITGLPSSSINRVYSFSPAISGFAGTVGFNFLDSELNGNSKPDLAIAYQSADAGPYTVTSPANVSGNFVSQLFTSPTAFRQITATNVTSALPVSLMAFNVKAEGGKARIEWVTASEKNNDFFRIERSADAANFALLAQVKGKGTTNIRQNYYTYDDSPEKGVTYYRLSQFDFDGAKKDYGVKAIVFSEGSLKVVAFPNPSAKEVFLLLPDTRAVSVRMVDMTGKDIYSEKLPAGQLKHQLNVPAGLPSGSYLIKVQGENISQSIRVALMP